VCFILPDILDDAHVQLIDVPELVFSFCCSGRIPRLSLIQRSLYVGVVQKPPHPPLTGKQYGKMEPFFKVPL